MANHHKQTPATMAGVLFCPALSVEDTLRPIAIQCNKHYLSTDFKTDKAFYDNASESQSAGGANVAGAERRSAAGLSRARRAGGGDD